MGLDTVELAIALEDEFRIRIRDEDAPKLGVIGDLFDYIVRALQQRGESPDEAQIWEQFRAVVVRELGLRADDVVRSAHIVRDLHAD